ncbi:MAG: hypothetical protein ACRCX2_23045, partial [Paraclostridium sp.]
NDTAVGCYLVIHDGENRTCCHFLDRDHPAIKGAINGIIRIATSVAWVESEPGVVYWSSTKSEDELKKDFLELAHELAKIHAESKDLLQKEKELETNIKAAPYAANCIARFDEYGLEVKLEMVSKKELATDKYIGLLEKELQLRNIDLPNKMSCLFNMNYQVIRVVKIK